MCRKIFLYPPDVINLDLDLFANLQYVYIFIEKSWNYVCNLSEVHLLVYLIRRLFCWRTLITCISFDRNEFNYLLELTALEETRGFAFCFCNTEREKRTCAHAARCKKPRRVSQRSDWNEINSLWKKTNVTMWKKKLKPAFLDTLSRFISLLGSNMLYSVTFFLQQSCR